MKKYLNKTKSIILIQILTDAIYIAAIASIPYIIKLLIDYDYSKGSKGIVIFILMYLFVVVVGMLFQYISQLYCWKFRKNFNILIKEDIFKSILNYSYKKFTNQN
ncbi:hypothetical protein [Clostridium tagluense]|uniref:Uncharacterized protein n=1 Tax=Clostridium tagluense TaxID=360422 RepID=A0A401US25_9CLOT|nr:hypothetical protein [Clostridium tagluense]GCD12359.1 hypothetical protein Ctaglu_39820 [Clostridium tagluense]